MDNFNEEPVMFEDNDGNPMNEADYEYFCALEEYFKDNDVTDNNR